MPRRDVVEAEIVEAVLDVLGPYGLSKAKRIADQVTKTFVAHGWQVMTWAEIDPKEDLPRFPLDG